MTFQELFSRYQKGAATLEEQKLVENELEKFELIETYFAGRMEEERFPEEELLNEADQEEVKGISKKVNRKFRNSILFSLLLAAALFFFARFACGLLFYNPNRGYPEIYGGDGQFYMDTSVFTELHSPGYSTEWAQALPESWGKYQIEVRQLDNFTGNTQTFNGQIVRGRAAGGNVGNLTIYPNLINRHTYALEAYWHFPSITAFGRKLGQFAQLDEDGNETYTQSPESIESTILELRRLPESSWVSAYVTFPEDLTLEEFRGFYEKWGPEGAGLDISYAAVRGSELGAGPVGFDPSGSWAATDTSPYEKEYPSLKWDINQESMTAQDQTVNWEQHFFSLLNYMANRPQFLNAMANVNGFDADYYKDTLSRAVTDGIRIYGVLVQGSVSQVADLASNDNIDGFTVDNVKLSFLSH